MIRLTNNVIRMPAILNGAQDPFVCWLRRLLPAHLYYVETHGPAVMLGKTRSKLETVNDLNGDVCIFYATMRDPDLSSLVSRRFTLSPDRHQAGADQTPKRVECACRFVQQCQQWMSSPTSPRADAGIPDRLAIFAPIFQRFDGVQVERLPVLDILHRYDSPLTCFMVDTTAAVPRRQMRASDDGGLPALLDAVCRVKGRVLLCGYADPLFDQALVGWRKVEAPKSIGIPTTHPRGSKFSWMNYPDPREVG